MGAWEPGLFTPPARVSLGANQLGSDAAADSALKDRLIARRLWGLLYQAEPSISAAQPLPSTEVRQPHFTLNNRALAKAPRGDGGLQDFVAHPLAVIR